MSGAHLTSRISKLGGTRQLPYAALAVAATSMVGVWKAANNDAGIEEEEILTKRSSSMATTTTPINHHQERQTKSSSIPNSESLTDRKPTITSSSLYHAIQENLARSSLNDVVNSTTTMSIAPCSCERRAQQVPGGNTGSYYYTKPNTPKSGKPKSVLTQDQGTAMVRKYKTLRLLDKFKTQTSVDSKYDWDKSKKVGEGAYSKVYQATSKETNEVVALKNISKEYTDSQYFQQEVEAMLYIQEKGGHPHVITLHEHFEDGDFFILILDFIQGGELFDHLIEMGAYSEMDASRIVREVASALLFLHGIGLVHADLKPEVGTSMEEQINIVLACSFCDLSQDVGETIDADNGMFFLPDCANMFVVVIAVGAVTN